MFRLTGPESRRVLRSCNSFAVSKCTHLACSLKLVMPDLEYLVGILLSSGISLCIIILFLLLFYQLCCLQITSTMPKITKCLILCYIFAALSGCINTSFHLHADLEHGNHYMALTTELCPYRLLAELSFTISLFILYIILFIRVYSAFSNSAYRLSKCAMIWLILLITVNISACITFDTVLAEAQFGSTTAQRLLHSLDSELIGLSGSTANGAKSTNEIPHYLSGALWGIIPYLTILVPAVDFIFNFVLLAVFFTRIQHLVVKHSVQNRKEYLDEIQHGRDVLLVESQTKFINVLAKFTALSVSAQLLNGMYMTCLSLWILLWLKEPMAYWILYTVRCGYWFCAVIIIMLMVRVNDACYRRVCGKVHLWMYRWFVRIAQRDIQDGIVRMEARVSVKIISDSPITI